MRPFQPRDFRRRRPHQPSADSFHHGVVETVEAATGVAALDDAEDRVPVLQHRGCGLAGIDGADVRKDGGILGDESIHEAFALVPAQCHVQSGARHVESAHDLEQAPGAGERLGLLPGLQHQHAASACLDGRLENLVGRTRGVLAPRGAVLVDEEHVQEPRRRGGGDAGPHPVVPGGVQLQRRHQVRKAGVPGVADEVRDGRKVGVAGGAVCQPLALAPLDEAARVLLGNIGNAPISPARASGIAAGFAKDELLGGDHRPTAPLSHHFITIIPLFLSCLLALLPRLSEAAPWDLGNDGGQVPEERESDAGGETAGPGGARGRSGKGMRPGRGGRGEPGLAGSPRL
mmetsp:Transcript_30211/g.74967  ORF Transcript_30211/g.74967 Transcript_30211/m.74967 type:complete len:345 (-) Transcript_30211:1682-2716(-)